MLSIATPLPHAPAPEGGPEQARRFIQRARVEIYCDHNAEAMACIQSAVRQLSAAPAGVPVKAMTALSEAAWLTRHDDYAAAERALEAALDGMPKG